jgi:hypothetical protein
VTKGGEQLAPVGVPSWRPLPDLPQNVPERLPFLEGRALAWPALKANAKEDEDPDCKAFLRISSQHWVGRLVPSARVQRWLGRPAAEGPGKPWRRLYLPVAAFLDDDDGDGDPLDDGELREAGPGAEVEIFCGKVVHTPGGSL